VLLRATPARRRSSRPRADAAGGLAEATSGSCARSCQRYERLVRAPALSLERLCERILSEHDYDLAVLARWDGGRASRTCASSAGSRVDYEAIAAGHRGFVRFVREQEALGAKELEAVAEEEGGGAVRC
jgi:hypothetical protein